MPIKIVTDSTADLPEAVISAMGITVVPCYINIAGRSYLDGVELSRQEFYERLPSCRPIPTTSAPGIGTFVQVYEQLAAGGASGIISVHISASLSNIVNVAGLAAQETTAVPVAVVDSGQLTLGTGLVALAAAEGAAAGRSLAEIVGSLRSLTARAYCFATLDTLEYLRRSGRVSRLQSSLGSLLQIKPLLKMHDGEMGMEASRTRRRAFERLIQLVTALGPLERLSLVHTHSLERVEALRQQAQHLFPPGAAPFCSEVTPTIGVHIGPGAVGFVCVTAC